MACTSSPVRRVAVGEGVGDEEYDAIDLLLNHVDTTPMAYSRQSCPGMIRRMKSLKSGTVKAVSP